MTRELEYLLAQINSKIERAKILTDQKPVLDILDDLLDHDLPEVYRLVENG